MYLLAITCAVISLIFWLLQKPLKEKLDRDYKYKLTVLQGLFHMGFALFSLLTVFVIFWIIKDK